MDEGDESPKSRQSLPHAMSVFLNVMKEFFLIRKPLGLSQGLFLPNVFLRSPEPFLPQGEGGNHEQ